MQLIQSVPADCVGVVCLPPCLQVLEPCLAMILNGQS